MDFISKRFFKDTQSRIITLGEITNENSTYIISEILEINKFDEKKKNKEPIELILTSCGGLVYDGFGIIDVIKNSNTPVHITCYGFAMSMALPILVSGHYRKMGKNSTLMYHDIGWETNYDKLKRHKESLEEGQRTLSIIDNILINKSNLSLNKLNKIKKMQQDWYITPKEALKLNIIDEII